MKIKKTVSVKDFGAVGNGVCDDTDAIQAALSSGADTVEIPFGAYTVTKTLYLPSDTAIVADRCARITLRPTKRLGRGDFLLSNADTERGTKNISITGGIWDGNNRAPECAKPDIFDKNGYSGAVLNFVNVNGLTLRGLTVANSTTYYVRMSRLENFVIEDIDLVSDEFGKNQDGLHFGGACRHGRVKNLRALSFGQTNDDMVALNADDSVERVENLDLCRDAIEDITFENIFSENAYTIIRMLSVTAPIRNIKFKNIYGGYRNYAINGDAARYCKTPLFTEEEYPNGVGVCENIEIENFKCFPVTTPPRGLEDGQINPEHALRLEGYFQNFKITGFEKLPAPEDQNTYALMMSRVKGVSVTTDGTEHVLEKTSDKLLIKNFNTITINRTEK